MGQSTNGMLFWGWASRSESEDGWGDSPPSQAVQELARERGDDYYKLGKELEAAHGISIENHCMADYPHRILCIKESYLSASRGYPETVPNSHLFVLPDWQARLDAACAALGIAPRPGQWILASYRG
jgi:hypothetical protein